MTPEIVQLLHLLAAGRHFLANDPMSGAGSNFAHHALNVIGGYGD